MRAIPPERPPERQPQPSRSRLFAIRIWRAEAGGETAFRGNIRDVSSGAWRSFRDWPDATAFMLAWIDEPARDLAHDTDGDQR